MYDDDNWSQCSISYPLLLFFSITIVGKKLDFMDKLLTSFDEGKNDDQTTVLLDGVLKIRS